ncbi:MAG: transposase [Gemmatimonas sp.]
MLMAHVEIAFTESGETYGAPRVHHELRAAGLPTRTERVARLRRQAGLVARRPKRGRVVTLDPRRAPRAESAPAAIRRARRGAESGVGRQHRVHPDLGGLPLSLDGVGPWLAALRRLGHA